MTYNPSMTEDEMNATYKENMRVALEKANVDAWTPAFRSTRNTLAEEFRRAWENWFAGRTDEARREERAHRAALRREQFERQFGVSDKAPPRTATAPATAPAGTTGASTAADAERAPAAPVGTPAAPIASTSASTTAPARRPTPAAARPAPAPMDFGDDSPEVVNKALRSLFGGTMEDSQ